MPKTKTAESAEKVERRERLAPDVIRGYRSGLAEFARNSGDENIISAVAWALEYCPKGSTSGKPRGVATHGTEAGYRRHKDDARRREEAGLSMTEDHDVFWEGIICDECEEGHLEHLATAKDKRNALKAQQDVIKRKCSKWFRANRKEASFMADEAEDLIEEAGGTLAAGEYEGMPTLGENTDDLDGLPHNVVLGFIASRLDIAKVKRGTWSLVTD